MPYVRQLRPPLEKAVIPSLETHLVRRNCDVLNYVVINTLILVSIFAY